MCRICWLLVASALLFGCAGTSEVVEVEDGTYEVSGFSTYRGDETSAEQAQEAAQQFCAKKGKKAKIVHMDTQWGRSERMDTKVVFTCE